MRTDRTLLIASWFRSVVFTITLPQYDSVFSRQSTQIASGGEAEHFPDNLVMQYQLAWS